MATISLDNGTHQVDVSEISDAEVANVMAHLRAGWWDEERELAHMEMVADSELEAAGQAAADRAFVARVAELVEERRGEVMTLS